MRTLLSWSSGKDSAWCLRRLRIQAEHQVMALLTTFSEDVGRVAMHATRRCLVRQQAAAVGLPLLEIALPRPCSNAEYECRLQTSLREAKRRFNLEAIAFGDLFLSDIRRYRERQMARMGLIPIFPLWAQPSDRLASSMITAGLRARLSCIDPRVMPRALAGRAFDHALLSDLPNGVDPCGENGEFHSFCWSGPMFAKPIHIRVGESVQRDGFVFTDLLPVGA